MKTLEVVDAIAPLSEYAQNINNESVLLTIDGKPVAALIAVDNADLETVALSTHPQFLELIDRSRTRQKSEGGVSAEEMRRRLGLGHAG